MRLQLNKMLRTRKIMGNSCEDSSIRKQLRLILSFCILQIYYQPCDFMTILLLQTFTVPKQFPSWWKPWTEVLPAYCLLWKFTLGLSLRCFYAGRMTFLVNIVRGHRSRRSVEDGLSYLGCSDQAAPPGSKERQKTLRFWDVCDHMHGSSHPIHTRGSVIHEFIGDKSQQ